MLIYRGDRRSKKRNKTMKIFSKSNTIDKIVGIFRSNRFLTAYLFDLNSKKILFSLSTQSLIRDSILKNDKLFEKKKIVTAKNKEWYRKLGIVFVKKIKQFGFNLKHVGISCSGYKYRSGGNIEVFINSFKSGREEKKRD